MKRTVRQLVLIATIFALTQQYLPAPIVETETPNPTPKQTPRTKAIQSKAPKRTASASPTASARGSLIQGTWVGTLKSLPGVGDVPITFVINAEGTLESETSSLGTFSRPGTFDGRTMTWHMGLGGTTTFIPSSDGRTAVLEGHNWFGHWSGVFRKTVP